MSYVTHIIESHIYLVFIIFLIYIIEIITGKYILVNWFKFKKDLESAKGSATREAILYFIYNVIYYIIKKYAISNSTEGTNFLIWCCITFILSILVRITYFKYQGINKNKADYLGLVKEKE
jgi:hypothetical protein